MKNRNTITADMGDFAMLFEGIDHENGTYSDVMLDRKDGSPAFSVTGSLSEDARTKCVYLATSLKRLSERLLDQVANSAAQGGING